MCSFLDTVETGLYVHPFSHGTVFFYTQAGKPSSLSDSLMRPNFLFFFSGEPVLTPKELKRLKETLKLYSASRPEAALLFAKQTFPPENWIRVLLDCTAAVGVYTLHGSTPFAIGGYQFELHNKSRLCAAADASGGEFLLFGVRCGADRSDEEDSGGYAAEFLYSGGYAGRMKECRLLMDGGLTGCFSFTLPGELSLYSLCAGLCYTMQREAPLRRKTTDTFFNAAIEPEHPISSMEASLDVQRPFDSGRSFLLLPSDTWQTGFPILLSDRNLVLESKAQAVKLVFARRRTETTRFAEQPYLTYDGSFTIKSPAGRLFTGLSGQEYVEFESGTGFYFKSGFQAYFPLNNQEPDDAEIADCAKTVGSARSAGDTAYAALEKGTYYSQSQDCSFYELGSENGILNYAEIPFQSLGREDFFPLLPLGMRQRLLSRSPFSASEQDTERILKALEERRLSVLRNELLGERKPLSAGAAKGSRILSTKGLYLTTEKGSGIFDTLEFHEKFRFGGVKEKLMRAFLAVHSFMVIADAAEFTKYASVLPESPPLNIGGWTFNLNPDSWNSNGTFLLLKYTVHKSIRGLAGTPAEWAYPSCKNSLREKASTALSAMLSNFLTLEDNPAYDSLRIILDDPLWCGVIAFNVPVEPGSLPDNIRFLMKTRDGLPITAHHLIFDSRSVREDNSISPGQADGVIRYEDPEHPILSETCDFYYKLDRLQVIIRQSQVTDFSCVLSLTLQYFLGYPLYTDENSLGNYMIISGRAVERKDAPGISDYLFELSESADYFAAGALFSNLIIDQISLTASAREARVSFFLSGRLKFIELNTDILSYGNTRQSEESADCREDGPAEESSLLFSDLLLQEDKGVLLVHTGTMKYRSGQSIPRKGSLAEQFPVRLDSFIKQPEEKKPEEMGYTGIQTDGIQQTELSGAWAAACWSIDLGGLGALSEAAGLEFRLITAWSAGAVKKEEDGTVSTGTPGLYIGARLGNFDGVNGRLPLEGMMSLSFSSVELKYSRIGEFYLYLRDFSLRFLKYSFPGSHNDIYIFSGPDSKEKLGWYAACESEKEG